MLDEGTAHISGRLGFEMVPPSTTNRVHSCFVMSIPLAATTTVSETAGEAISTAILGLVREISDSLKVSAVT